MRNTDKKKENMVLMSMRISAEDKELKKRQERLDLAHLSLLGDVHWEESFHAMAIPVF